MNTLPPELLHPVLTLALRLSLSASPSPWPSAARDYGSRARTALRLVCTHWSDVLGPGAEYAVRTAREARALTAVWRREPPRAARAEVLYLVNPNRFFVDITDWDLTNLLELCTAVQVLHISVHPNQWEPEGLKNVLRGYGSLRVLDLGQRTILSGILALLLPSWPQLADLRTTRLVTTSTLPRDPYPSLSCLTVSLIHNDALRGLASFLPLCPHLTDLRIPFLDTTSSDVSYPFLSTTLKSLPASLVSLSLKVNHESSFGGVLAPPVLDAILPDLTSLTHLELASHGFSTFEFLHRIKNLENLIVVHVDDDMRALVPWDLEDLANELAQVGVGRRLIVQVLMRGRDYERRAAHARVVMERVQKAEGIVQCWVGMEGSDEERRVFPAGAEWT